MTINSGSIMVIYLSRLIHYDIDIFIKIDIDIYQDEGKDKLHTIVPIP